MNEATSEAAPGGHRVHVAPVQVRFSDTDMFGHVNNVVFASWAEVARIAFLRGLEPSSGDLILARIELDFLRQVRFGDAVAVESRVAGVGRTSVTLDQTVLANDEPAARIGSVVVLYDYDAQRTRPVPDAYREALAPYLVEEA